jgi:hypothetical protein
VGAEELVDGSGVDSGEGLVEVEVWGGGDGWTGLKEGLGEGEGSILPPFCCDGWHQADCSRGRGD